MLQQRLHLLLVDDERSLREPLQRHLQGTYGFEVDSAAHAAEALLLVRHRQGHYDVALIDHTLIPGPDGLELMRDIKSAYPDIECIIMTGWGTESRQAALESGAFRYIEKPFDQAELALLIRSAAQQVRLRAISRNTLSKRQLEVVLREIAGAALSLTQADQAWIVLYSEIADELRVFGGAWSDAPSKDGDLLASSLLTEIIIESGRALSIPDIEATDQDLPPFLDPGHRSLVGVPIPGERGNQGVLYAASHAVDHFAGGLVDPLQTLAQQAGVAIVNARVFQYTEALVRTGREMTRATTLEEQLQLAWEFIRDHLRASTFLVALYDRDTNTIEFPLIYDKGEEIGLAPIPLGDDSATWPITGYVVKNGQELYWPTSAARRTECTTRNISSRALGDPCETCFYFPLVFEDQIIGAISVQAYHAHAFPPPLLDACRALGNHLAAVIQNARLLRRSQDQAANLDRLHQLSVTLASSLDLNEIMTFTCQAAVEFFQADHSGLVLFDEDRTQGQVKAEFPPHVGSVGTVIPVQDVPDEERLAHAGEPLIVDDVEHQDTLGPVRDILFGRLDVRSILIVPIETEGKRLGSFSLDAIGRRRHFKSEEIALCRSFAASVAVAIERARRHQQLERQAQLLAALEDASRHIRAVKEPARLQQEVVRLAAQLMGCDCAALFNHQPYRHALDIAVVYGLPAELLTTVVADGEGLVGKAIRTGELNVQDNYAAWEDRDPVFLDQGFTTAVAVPIRKEEGIAAVLFLANTRATGKCSQQDLEILQSFAFQASIALQTSRALTQEQRSLSTLAVIRKASDYIQAAGDVEDILHVVLTGVTAHYGLGFNRSAILLLDDTASTLFGRIGIGQFTEAQAQAAWRRDRMRGLDDFDRYIHLLEANDIGNTQMDEAIRRFSLALSPSGSDLFSRVVREQRLAQVTAAQRHSLPESFCEAFAPAFPLVVAPLVARNKTIGILVADNKFTLAPITNETVSALQTFVNAASLAIYNAQLFEETRQSQDRLRSYYEASNAIVTSLDLDNLLREIVERARCTAAALSAGMVLLTKEGQVRKLIVAGAEKPTDLSEMVRPDGLSVQVMRTGQPIVVPDTAKEPERINPSGFWRGVRAAMGLPVTLESRHLGVVWFYYPNPRSFSQPEIDAAQLYVNQAAIAYDNARRVEELEQMRRAAEAMARTTEPRQALQQIVDSAALVLHADSAAIWSFDDVRNKFIPDELTAYGIPGDELESLRQAESKPGQTAENVMKLGYVQVVDLADPTHTFLGQPTRDLLDRIGVRSFQAVSLHVGEERLGVLYANYHQKRAFGEEEETTLRTFASHAALALKSARLLAQLERTKQAASVVAGSVVQQDLKVTLDQIAQSTCQVLDADCVSVYAYDESQGAFSEMGAKIVDQVQPQSVRTVDKLASSSVAFRILHLEGPETYHVVEDRADEDTLLQGYFVTEEGIKAAIGIQLRANDRIVGVMFVNFRSSHRFTSDEIATVQLFANQAAAAIRNTQLYGEVSKVAVERERLLGQSQLVAEISREAAHSLAIDAFLESLFSRLTRVFSERSIPVYASLGTFDAGAGVLVTYETRYYPSDGRPRTVPIAHKGIMAWVARHRLPYYAVDVNEPEHAAHYAALLPDTRSEIAVPVFYDNDLLGVLDLESPVVAAFTSQDLDLLETLANQLAVTIHNIQQFEELGSAKNLVSSRTAVAWLGIGNAELRHRLVNDATAARDRLALLREDLGDGKPPEVIEEHIRSMEQSLKRVVDAPRAVALLPDEGVELLPIGRYLAERVAKLSKREPYRDLKLTCQVRSGESALVRVNRQWFASMLDLLIQNAATAVGAVPDKQITLTVDSSPGRAVVAVTDNGTGIPREVLPYLFRVPIRVDQGAKGTGVGLLLAQTIVQTYGGDIKVGATGPAGTTMTFWLPAVELVPSV